MAEDGAEDYIGAMKLAAAALLALLALPAAAGEAVPPVSAQRPRLHLGPFAPGGPDLAEIAASVPVAAVTEGSASRPRFREDVLVNSPAQDAEALTAKMDWWLRDYSYVRGANGREGSAPSVEETLPMRPHNAPSVDFLAVAKWLKDKLGN